MTQAFRKGLRLGANNLGKLIPIYLVVAVLLALIWFLQIAVASSQADNSNLWVILASFWITFTVAWSVSIMIRSALVACLLLQVQSAAQPTPVGRP